MANKEYDTATYLLKIVMPPHADGTSQPIYQLEGKNKDASGFKEYDSPEELVQSIIRNHDQLVRSKTEGDQNELKLQIAALKELLTCKKDQLKRLRFLMTDRITSAMTRLTMLKGLEEERFTDAEQSWLNQGIRDLTRLAYAIEDWNRLCEAVDINQLGYPDKVEKMITEVCGFE